MPHGHHPVAVEMTIVPDVVARSWCRITMDGSIVAAPVEVGAAS